MAQSAGFLSQDNRTDMGIPVFCTTANSDPPWNFKIWLDQFFLAVTVKESVNPELLLEEPKEVLLEPLEEIDEYIKQQSNRNQDIKKSSKDIQKVDIRRNTRSKQIRSLKALVRIDHQIISMTIDTGSAKQILESSKNMRFIPRENLNLTTKFLDYNKQPIKRGKEKKMVRIQDRNNTDTLREEITETTFQRTRMIQRTPNRSDSENSDFEQIPQANWNLMNRQIRTDTGNSGQSTSTATTAQPMLVSFWELIGSEKSKEPRSTMEIEADSVMQSPKPPGQTQSGDEPEIGQIIEVDLTMDSIDEPDYSSGTETCMVTPQQKTRGGHKSRKSNNQLSEQLNETNGPLSFEKLFDKSLLAELVSEATWMDQLRRVVERNDRHGVELMGPYTNPLWHQMSVVDDCLLVDNRLDVPEKLRQAVLRRLHQGHPGQEAMLEVSNYLWWPHMHKYIVNMAEECRSCTRYGKNAKYIILKISAKPLPLLTQPGQVFQLDYAGPLEDHKGKKIYLLVAIDRYSKFPSVKVTKSTGRKSTINFLRTYIDTWNTRIDQNGSVFRV